MAWKYFSQAEMACKCGCGEAPMDEDFMRVLDAIREDFGKPLAVSSGYRCPSHNAVVSSTGSTGPHTTGCAADVKVSGADAHRILELALQYGAMGIGVSQKGPHGSRFIHIDTIHSGNRPWIWSY